MDLTTIAQREQVLRGELAAAREAVKRLRAELTRAEAREAAALKEIDRLEGEARLAFCRARGEQLGVAGEDEPHGSDDYIEAAKREFLA